MLAQLSIQIYIKSSKVNCKLSKTSLFDSVWINCRSHIWLKESQKLNWLPVSEKFSQQFYSNCFGLFSDACPSYLHDIYQQSNHNQANTRSLVLKLKNLQETHAQPTRNRWSGQITLSYLISVVWNTNINYLP